MNDTIDEQAQKRADEFAAATQESAIQHSWYVENRNKYPDFTVLKKADVSAAIEVALGSIKHPFVVAPEGLDTLTLKEFDIFVANMKVRLGQYEADVKRLKALWADLNPSEYNILVRDISKGIRIKMGWTNPEEPVEYGSPTDETKQS